MLHRKLWENYPERLKQNDHTDMGTELRNFFGQLNFALSKTNVQGVTIMKNQSNGDTLFVVLLDNAAGQVWSAGVIGQIYAQLSRDGTGHVLFLIVTDNPLRDQFLANVQGPVIWLADSQKNKLEIPQGQDTDFYGLRYGLEQTVEKTTKKEPWNPKEAFRDKSKIPYVTIGLIAVNVIWFIVLVCTGDTESAEFMWQAGASYGPSVFSDHEYWRLITCMFMHFGVTHLLGNMIYLGIAGNQAESEIGHLKFFVIYMLSGIASSVVSTAYYYLNGQYTVSAGASGAIYGIIGIIIYLMVRNRSRTGSQALTTRIVLIIAFIIFSNFVAGSEVDVVAHIAGLIFGFLFSLAMVRGG